MEQRIGVVSIIVHNRREASTKVNAVLADFGDMILGRMGLPYPPKEIGIISLIVHGSTDAIGSLTGKLGQLPHVDVKSVLTKA